jgi:hypothetical protein
MRATIQLQPTKDALTGVRFSPPDLVRRRLATWSGIQGDSVEITRLERFEYGLTAVRSLRRCCGGLGHRLRQEPLVITRSPCARAARSGSSRAASGPAGLRGLRADDGMPRWFCVLRAVGRRRITGRRGRTRVAFEPHGGFRDRARPPRLRAFADMPAPSCPVLEAMRSPRLPSGMDQSGPKPVMARG